MNELSIKEIADKIPGRLRSVLFMTLKDTEFTGDTIDNSVLGNRIDKEDMKRLVEKVAESSDSEIQVMFTNHRTDLFTIIDLMDNIPQSNADSRLPQVRKRINESAAIISSVVDVLKVY